jgi:hypothetical protein
MAMRRLLTALVLLGVALRAVAYFGNSSLWLDEILLSRNIIELPMRELLFAPLALDQVAPRGFLFVEKLAVIAFGPHELALRLFPFLCGLASVVLFRRLAERALTGAAVPVAVALFAIGVPFLKYGAEVKQYQIDATAAILLMLLALPLIDPDPARTPALSPSKRSMRHRILVGLAGFVVVCFSQASVLVMGGIGAAMAGEWLLTRSRPIGQTLVTTIPLWAIASIAGIVMGLASMSPSTREFMDDFWAVGFAPLSRVSALPGWYWDRLASLFTEPVLLRYGWPAWFLTIAAAGIVWLWRQRRSTLLIVAAPIAMTLIAATAHQYPFRQRLVFFLVPSVLLLIAAGAECLRVLLARVHPVAGLVPLALCVGPAVVAIVSTPPPYEIEQSRALLGHLQQHRKVGDTIFVYPLSRIGVLYYGKQFGVLPGDLVTAICSRDDTRAYLRDVDQFRGRARVWVYTAAQRPFRVARSTVRAYLQTIGVRRDSITLPSMQYGEVSLDLYDLSDPARLAASTAETFPAPPMPTDPSPGCRPWTRGDMFELR